MKKCTIGISESGSKIPHSIQQRRDQIRLAGLVEVQRRFTEFLPTLHVLGQIRPKQFQRVFHLLLQNFSSFFLFGRENLTDPEDLTPRHFKVAHIFQKLLT